MANQSVWDDIIKKYFVFVPTRTIGKENPLEALVMTINCYLIEDSETYKISPYALKNLREFFPHVDNGLKDIASRTFFNAGSEKVERMNFIMSMATDILNYYPEIEGQITKKAEEMCVPFPMLYIALAVHTKEMGESEGLLKERGDKIIKFAH